MIPLRDNIPRKSFPFVTLLIIAANCVVFYREISLDSVHRELLIHTFALIPARTMAFFAGHHVSPNQALLPFFTAMFLHGGWMHLIGNMWFLWIFGDNVEDRIGHMQFLVLYLLAGIAGTATFLYFSMGATTPMLGASGAIAGVMGAYVVTFPRAKVLTLVFIVIYVTTFEIPAYAVLLYWLVLQLFSGVISIGTEAQGGTAWFAHVGGFLAGIPLMLVMRMRRN